jgi:hypothetical protein
MIETVLKARFEQYAPRDAMEQENMLKETMQLYILASLSKHGLFREAIFHGGTCLRIVNAMPRFSEDLDFLLKTPNARFRWHAYLTQVKRDCDGEGITFESVDRDSCDTTVRKAFLKTDSVGTLLTFQFPFGRHRSRKIRVKLEVDINPPAGSSVETAYLDFPRPAPLTVQTLESGFALKLHALLCRSYVKGRDWYDFLWYMGRQVRPNLPLLANALQQQGPWNGAAPGVTHDWLAEHLAKKIDQVDWILAREDVQRFLPHGEQEALESWDRPMFQYQAARLHAYS